MEGQHSKILATVLDISEEKGLFSGGGAQHHCIHQIRISVTVNFTEELALKAEFY